MSMPPAVDPVPAFGVTSRAAPYKTNRTSVFIILLIALVIVVAGFAVSGTLLVRYMAKFAEIDRTHESLSWDGAPGEILHTTYTNPAYGLTLKLPGRWLPSERPASDPYLFHLVAFDGFHALFWPEFPVLTSSVNEDAARFVRGYETRGWRLDSEESTSVSGLPAHVLRFDSPRGNADLVIVKKGPALYTLSVAGPASDLDHWKMVRAALLQAIQIN